MSTDTFKTVWLIDDDDLCIYVNNSILNSQNFAKNIVPFAGIAAALEALELAVKGATDFPEVIFLDLEMPGLDGWDFLKTYKMVPEALKQNCNVYMLSSSINEADVKKAKAYKDVCCFIVKPLTISDLVLIRTTGKCFQHEK